MKKMLVAFSVSLLFLTAGCADQSASQNQAPTPDQSSQMDQSAQPVAADLSGQAMTTEQSTQATQTDQSANNQSTMTPPSATNSTDPQLSMPVAGDTIATMVTDLGTIKIRLFTKQVPTLTTNFIKLAEAGKYDNTPFHRVVQDFMIQGGDFTNKDGTGGYSYKGPNTFLPNEIDPSLHHLYGTLSMAKTSDPVSIGSQFFIVTNKDGTPFLDGGYSPIGQVYEGMDIADQIQNLQVPGTEQPSKIINVKSVTISTYKGK